MLARTLLALALAQADATAHAPPPSETLRYKFDAASELDDFDAIAGSWTISTGNLWCTSKGAREELRWRRDLSAAGSASVKLVGAGRVALALSTGKADSPQELLVRLDRGEQRIAVECGGKVLLERPFEPPASGPIALAVDWTLDHVLVRVGDDEPLRADRPACDAPFARLALLSMKSQPRFDDLVVVRETPAPRPETAPGEGPPPLGEDQRIAIERASKRIEAGDLDAAFELVAKSLPPAATGNDGAPAPLPEPVVVILERLGTLKPALKAKPPLKERVAAATIAAKDGSATLVLPLRAGWSATTPEIRRIDGPVFTLKCDAPKLEVEVYRYDQKLKYWFGRDPKIVYSTGGGGPTLGRARADDEKDQHPQSTLTRPFEKSKVELGGPTYEYELAWPDPEDPGRTRALRELFTLHRGDTWRVTITGSPLDLDLARDDVEWLLSGFELAKD
jgi:hypothetical protein